jgi:hypothetical protein
VALVSGGAAGYDGHCLHRDAFLLIKTPAERQWARSEAIRRLVELGLKAKK